MGPEASEAFTTKDRLDNLTSGLIIFLLFAKETLVNYHVIPIVLLILFIIIKKKFIILLFPLLENYHKHYFDILYYSLKLVKRGLFELIFVMIQTHSLTVTP